LISWKSKEEFRPYLILYKGEYMTKLEMFETIKSSTILETLLEQNQIELVSKDVRVFFKRRHNLPMGVLNAILFLTIITTGDNLFNEAYLRKVTETFKAEGAITTALAIQKLERDQENTKQRIRKQTQKVSEPDWMPGVIASFKMN